MPTIVDETYVNDEDLEHGMETAGDAAGDEIH
jgi:hypothetical protein